MHMGSVYVYAPAPAHCYPYHITPYLRESDVFCALTLLTHTEETDRHHRRALLITLTREKSSVNLRLHYC